MVLGLREDVSLSSRGPKPAIFTIINRQHHDYNGVVRQTKTQTKNKMKLVNKILVLSSFIFVCSCSNEDNLVPEVDSNGVQASEFPIQLGGSSVVTTRAAITGNGSEGIPGIAVWCLAKDVMMENLDPQGIRWFDGAPEHQTCCIMKNVKSNIVGGTVKWDNINDRYFYPVTQFYRYEFYANYPYTTNLAYNVNSVHAKYEIDGTQDLLWGRATSNEEYAWSAKYFRVNGGQTISNRPNLKMEHLLTRLVFNVMPGAQVEIPGAQESEMDYTAASSMIVDTLQVCNAYTDLSVVIADYTRLDMGTGERLQIASTQTDTLFLKSADGAIVAPIQVPALPSLKQQWGESIMLFPSDRYVLRMVLHDNTGRKFVSEQPLVVSNSGGFERGKSYNINITVHGPSEVTLGAELTPWEVVDGPGLNL